MEYFIASRKIGDLSDKSNTPDSVTAAYCQKEIRRHVPNTAEFHGNHCTASMTFMSFILPRQALLQSMISSKLVDYVKDHYREWSGEESLKVRKAIAQAGAYNPLLLNQFGVEHKLCEQIRKLKGKPPGKC